MISRFFSAAQSASFDHEPNNPAAKRSSSALRRPALLTMLAASACLLTAPAAMAATPAPGWTIQSLAEPTNFTPGDSSGNDAYAVAVDNVGSRATDGSPVTITDTLPENVTAQSVSFYWSQFGFSNLGFLCTTAPLQCALPSGYPIAPGDTLEMVVYVAVDSSAAGGLTNTATVSGGGAPTVSTSAGNAASSTPAPFGITSFSADLAGVDGAPDTQAGDHPYAMTTTITMADQVAVGSVAGSNTYANPENVKDVVVDLPLGLVADPQAAAQCPLATLTTNACPLNSAIGTVKLNFANAGFPFLFPNPALVGSLYNLVPEHGHPAEFGFVSQGISVVLYASVVPTPRGYVLRTTSPDLANLIGGLADVSITIFGNPAAQDGGGGAPAAFFTNPTDCSAGVQAVTVHVDSWQNPGRTDAEGNPDVSDPNWKEEKSTLPPVSGCNQLRFQPTISVRPDTAQADSPAGLDVDLRVPQAPNVPGALATPELRKAVVTLPQGITVNPSAADGLGSCSPAQIDLASAAEPTCPDSSKVGTVALQTPLLPGTLSGSIYLATQNDNPFNSLLAGYIVVDDPTTGVVIKIPGNLTPDPTTGQITGVFDNNPQLPFSDLKLDFFGGSRAALRTPSTCGTFTTTSELTPWSAPDSGPPATPSDSFNIDSGPGGTPCANSSAARPFDPAFSAGTVIPIAGAYSPFVLKLSRQDGSQEIKSLDTTLPPGLTGKLAGIPYCPEANLAGAANNAGAAEQSNPSCPATSQVGTVNVGAGAGSSPLYVGGTAYLAGPYKGAPLSLAIVTPAVAGPFDLGTVVVRAALYVDPTTTQIHAVGDPIPTILAGIPLDVRSIALEMNRNQFTLNPTSCAEKTVLGSATSLLGQVAPLSQRFQVGECSKLGFAPKLKLSLTGGTKRNRNPALKAVVTYPKKGSYANIARAAVTLPHSEFLDNAHIRTICTRVIFAEGAVPGEKCPAASIYGFARATTPLLDKPVEGPVYLRASSNKLPDLVAALNGQIDVVLDGKIDTGKSGGIRNTFEVVPDAPVTKFTLEMAGGKKGLLVNSENLCSPRAKTKAVANFTAQNGKTYDTTPAVTNSCKKNKKHRGKR